MSVRSLVLVVLDFLGVFAFALNVAPAIGTARLDMVGVATLQ
jgi:hypothetical protein